MNAKGHDGFLNGDVGVVLSLFREQAFLRTIGKGGKTNQVCWRNTMVNGDGSVKKCFRTGYWDISDKGRIWLKPQGGDLNE